MLCGRWAKHAGEKDGQMDGWTDGRMNEFQEDAAGIVFLSRAIPSQPRYPVSHVLLRDHDLLRNYS